MDISQSEKTVIDLIDQLIANGQESCSRFLEVLKEPEVLKTYPQLNKLVLRNNWIYSFNTEHLEFIVSNV